MHLLNCDECIAKELILKEHLEAWQHIWKVQLVPDDDDSNVVPIWEYRSADLDVDKDNISGEVVGQKDIPVVAYSRKISKSLSILLKPFKKLAEVPCDVTEDLLYRVRECNKSQDLDACVVGVLHLKNNQNETISVESADIDILVERCLEVIMNSHIEFENVDIKEVGLYLSLYFGENLLKGEHLLEYCPSKMNNNSGEIKRSGSKNDGKVMDRWNGFEPAVKDPDYLTARKMILTALDYILKITLNHHECAVNKSYFKQLRDDGVIKDVFRFYKVWWDRELRKIMAKQSIFLKLCVRYDDVSVVVLKPIQSIDDNNVDDVNKNDVKNIHDVNRNIDDKTTFQKIKEMARRIDGSIKPRIDFPSNNPNNRVVINDLELWIDKVKLANDDDEKTQIIHSHYNKAISAEKFVHVNSDMSYLMKMNVLTNDLVRVMRNVSAICCNAERIMKVQEYLKNLQTYGYSKNERVNIFKRAKHRYEKIILDEEELELYQNKYWQPNMKNGEKGGGAKKIKKDIWVNQCNETSYFEEAEKIQTLANKRYEKIMKTYGYPVKVVEDCSESLRDELVRSNPFQATKCQGESCRICSNVRIRSVVP